MEKKTFIADKNGKLIKTALRVLDGVSYSALMKCLRKKDVKINGKRTDKDIDLSAGDEVTVFLPETEKSEKYSVIYSDDNVLVIDKKSGFTSESVYADIKDDYSDVRFVHRLDRNTSGVMIFAKGNAAETALLSGFRERDFIKTYRARVKGCPKEEEAVLNAYLLKDPIAATVKIFDKPVKGSVPIKTGYKVLFSDGDTSILSVRLYTGKTHQIRAHLAHIGYPLVGDGKYGDNDFNRAHGAKSQELTAYSLTLRFAADSPLYYLNEKTFYITD